MELPFPLPAIPTTVPTEAYLILSGTLFALGCMGVMLRKSALTIFMSIELMLNAVNLAFVAFARQLGQFDGQIFVFFVLAVAAAEAALGLALLIAAHRHRQSIDLDDFTALKW